MENQIRTMCQLCHHKPDALQEMINYAKYTCDRCSRKICIHCCKKCFRSEKELEQYKNNLKKTE